MLFVFTVRAGLALLALRSLLRDARATASPEPEPGARQPQPVSWWSLLQNGFQPHRYEDPLSGEGATVPYGVVLQ